MRSLVPWKRFVTHLYLMILADSDGESGPFGNFPGFTGQLPDRHKTTSNNYQQSGFRRLHAQFIRVVFTSRNNPDPGRR